MESNETPSNAEAAPPLLGWFALNQREQLVWAARYASSALPPGEAALNADKAVMALQEINVDGKEFLGPEYDACRYYSWMEYDEFRSWYPTALKIAMRGHFKDADFSEAACRNAYERYKRSAADFY